MNNIDIKNYKSRWDFMADRAGVKRTADLSAPVTQFTIVGRFIGDWSRELTNIIEKYNGGREFNFLTKLKLKSKLTLPYTEKLDRADMDAAGISDNSVFVSKITPKEINESLEEIPTISKMINWFGFTGLVLPKIHIQYPGQVFPFHFDDLTTHRNNSSDNLEVDISHTRFARVEVQLLDWQYGHVWAVGNNYWTKWQAGEIMWHHWYDTPHGTGNLGMTPRINLQITGEVSDELYSRLNRNNGDIIL